MSASPESPLRGGCNCGAVRFEVRGPFTSALYCHCHRCQRRTGVAAAASARLDRAHFAITRGADLIRSWEPDGGMPKAFCANCGSHLFAGSLDGDALAVRLGAIDGDPGIRPEYRQWVSSAAPWEAIPDDGLPRYEGARPQLGSGGGG
ncbi:MAG TPA: GFA family protein [Solirubrobacterales bacterium]|nr:GFA family protein [Solirubrobacterales bacterium]